jgi:hypothetical protein
MLAGPIPRKTKRRNIGSVDQLIGVGVGLGVGVAVAACVGAGVCDADGVCDETGLSARAPSAPKVTVTNTNAAIANTSAVKSRVERHVSFIGEIPFIELW